MSLRDKYYIRGITSKEANAVFVRYHYLHRKAQITYAFGLFEKDGNKQDLFVTDKLIGCVAYGMPASPNVCRGICGPDYFKDVIELTRLWIEDNTPKNVESFLIGNTIKKLDKNIIISYSEPDEGHLGIVYQATNFIYTGLTAKRTNRVPISGSTQKHNRHECMKKENTMLVPRPRKHRYIFFNGNKRKKKELIKALKYKIEPYPKHNGFEKTKERGQN